MELGSLVSPSASIVCLSKSSRRRLRSRRIAVLKSKSATSELLNLLRQTNAFQPEDVRSQDDHLGPADGEHKQDELDDPQQQEPVVEQEHPHLWQRVVDYLQRPVFAFNAAAPTFAPANAAADEQDLTEKPEFSKQQVKDIIQKTSEQAAQMCLAKHDEACGRYERIILDLQAKLALAEASLITPCGTDTKQRQEQEVACQRADSSESEQKRGCEHEGEQHQHVLQQEDEMKNAVVGDYGELAGLKAAELNGEKGVVRAMLATGRLQVELGAHLMHRKVCVRPNYFHVLASGADIASVKKLRDNGASVETLLEQGFSICTLQQDDSGRMCDQCGRPRYMCSCTVCCCPLATRSLQARQAAKAAHQLSGLCSVCGRQL